MRIQLKGGLLNSQNMLFKLDGICQTRTNKDQLVLSAGMRSMSNETSSVVLGIRLISVGI